MYLKNSVIGKFIGLFFLVFGLPVISSTNKNCGGKAFHCVNATHFMICVDLGNGISTTVDDFVIPCPESTICSRLNRFECEFPQTTTLVHSLQLSDVTNDKQLENYIVTNTLPWEEIDVATTIPTQNVRERSEKYINSNSKPSQNVDVSTNASETTIEDMLDIIDKNTYYVFENSNQTKTSVPLELYAYESGQKNKTDNMLTTTNKINSAATESMVVKEATSVKEYTHGYKTKTEKDNWYNIETVTEAIAVESTATTYLTKSTDNVNNEESTPLVTFVADESVSEMITASILVGQNQEKRRTEKESTGKVFTENYLFPASTSLLEITDLNASPDLTINKNIDNNKLGNNFELTSDKTNGNLIMINDPRYVYTSKSIKPNENHTEMFLLPVTESKDKELLNTADINDIKKLAQPSTENVFDLSTESYAARKLIDSNTLTSNDFFTNVGNTHIQRVNQDNDIRTSSTVPQPETNDVEKVFELYSVTMFPFLNTKKIDNVPDIIMKQNKNSRETQFTTLNVPTTDPDFTQVFTIPVYIDNTNKNVSNDINYLETKHTESRTTILPLSTDISFNLIDKTFNSYDVMPKNEGKTTWETLNIDNTKYTTPSTPLYGNLDKLETITEKSSGTIPEKANVTIFKSNIDKTPDSNYSTYDPNEIIAFPNKKSNEIVSTKKAKKDPSIVKKNTASSGTENILEPSKYTVLSLKDNLNYITDTKTTITNENTERKKNVYYTWPTKKMLLDLERVTNSNHLSESTVKNKLIDKTDYKTSTEVTMNTSSANLSVSTRNTDENYEYSTKKIYESTLHTESIAKVLTTTEFTQLLKSTDSEYLSNNYKFISIDAPTTQRSNSPVTNTKYDIWFVDHILPISQDAKKSEKYSAPIFTTFEQSQRESMPEITPNTLVHDENETYTPNTEKNIPTVSNGTTSDYMLVNDYNSGKSPDNGPSLLYNAKDISKQKIENAEKHQHDLTSSTIKSLERSHETRQDDNITSKTNLSLFSPIPTKQITDNSLLQQIYYSTTTDITYTETNPTTQINNMISTNHNYFSFWPTKSKINIFNNTLDIFKIKSENDINVLKNNTATPETDDKNVSNRDNTYNFETITSITHSTIFDASNLMEISTPKNNFVFSDNNALFVPPSTQEMSNKELGTNTDGFERNTLPIKNKIFPKYQATKSYSISEENFELISPYVKTIKHSTDRKSIDQMLLTTIKPSYKTIATDVSLGSIKKMENLRVPKPLQQPNEIVTVMRDYSTQTDSSNIENTKTMYDQILLTSTTTPYKPIITPNTDYYRKENQKNLKLDKPSQQFNKILSVQGDSLKTESSKLESIKDSIINNHNDQMLLLTSMTTPYETLLTMNTTYIEKDNWKIPINIEALQEPHEFIAVIPSEEGLILYNQEKKGKLVLNPTKVFTKRFEEIKSKETQLQTIPTKYQKLVTKPINDDPIPTTWDFDYDKNLQTETEMEPSLILTDESDPMITIDQPQNLYGKIVSVNSTTSKNDTQKYNRFTTNPSDYAPATDTFAKAHENSTPIPKILHSIYDSQPARLININPNLETNKNAALHSIDLQSNVNDFSNAESSMNKQFNIELPNISVFNKKTSKTDSWYNTDVTINLKQREKNSTSKHYNSKTTEMPDTKTHAARTLATDDSYKINHDIPSLSKRDERNYENDIRILPIPTMWSFQDKNQTIAVAKQEEFLNYRPPEALGSMTSPALVWMISSSFRNSESYSRKPLIITSNATDPRNHTTKENEKFGQEVVDKQGTTTSSLSSGYMNTWQEITKQSGIEKNPETFFKFMKGIPQIRVITNKKITIPYSERSNSSTILSDSISNNNLQLQINLTSYSLRDGTTISSKKVQNLELENKGINSYYADDRKLQSNVTRWTTPADFDTKQNENTQSGMLQPLFSCKNRQRGRYSDINDCKKFYICMGRTEPIIGFCPNNTVFSEIRKQCTKNLSHCIRDNQFRCVTEGRFYDCYKKKIYYICVKNKMNIFVRFQFQCQNGYYLDKKLVKCIINKRIIKKATSNIETASKRNSSDSSISKYANERSESRENNVSCRRNGIFADPSDSRAYYICCRIRGRLHRKRKRCESDQIYDSVRKRCEDADSSENGS